MSAEMPLSPRADSALGAMRGPQVGPALPVPVMSDSIDGGARVAAVSVLESRVATVGELRFRVVAGPLRVEVSRSWAGPPAEGPTPSFLKLQSGLLRELSRALEMRSVCGSSRAGELPEKPAGLLGALGHILSEVGIPLGPGVRLTLGEDPACENLYHLPRQGSVPETPEESR